ncbi:MAG: LysR family transcriptional regulator [Nevskia sp.]
MELRHFRYYIAVAEELHFVRAAERLHIEQSPLSRAIKDLEFDLGVRLLDRTTRSTRMTWAGQVFLDEARRVIAAVDQSKSAAKAAANGYHGHLRIALSDGITHPRFAALIARCREEEPDIEVRIFEMPLAQQVKGLRSDLLDAGFALASDVGDGLIAEPVWTDPVAVLMPAGHPLAAFKRVALADVLRHPLVLCHPQAGSGGHQQVEVLLRSVDAQPIVADYATTLGVKMTMVGAGYGIGFVNASQVTTMNRPDVVVRPLAGRAPKLTTYLIRPEGQASAPLTRLIERGKATGVQGRFTAPSVAPSVES